LLRSGRDSDGLKHKRAEALEFIGIVVWAVDFSVFKLMRRSRGRRGRGACCVRRLLCNCGAVGLNGACMSSEMGSRRVIGAGSIARGRVLLVFGRAGFF